MTVQGPLLSRLGMAALEYSERGWFVFPLKSGGKLPLISKAMGGRGHLDATTDAALIRRWWTATPNANIGLYLAASGLVAIDPDTYKPECQWHSFIAGRDLPDTLTQTSARGGKHYIFEAPSTEDFADEVCAAVDIKHRGYIVLAPSTFDCKEYVFDNDDDPAPCPDWVPRKGQPPRLNIDTGIRSGLTDEDYAQLIRNMSSDTGKHYATRDFAMGLAGLGFPERLTRMVIYAHCPVRDDNLEDSIRSAYAKHPEDTAAIEAGDDPVDLWGTFPAPDLPTGLLPDLIERFARVQGDRMGADPAGLAVAALVTCAATISDRIKLQVKRHDTWTESARIWAALVGSPSTKKSPILSAATAPLCRIDGEMFREWQQRKREWDALPKEERAAIEAPKQKRLRIGDTTPEAAQQVLEGSPDGVMCLQDELSGFFGSMDRYAGGKGSSADRAFWLQAFNGGEYTVNRVGRGASLIPNLSVCLLGGIQPEPIRKVAADAHDDGLLQRLFPIVLKPATMGRDEPAPDVVSQYRDLVEALHKLRPPSWMGAGVVQFSDGAQKVRRDLEEKHLRLQTSEAVNRKLASHIGKYDGIYARLCLVWHCIEFAQAEHLPETIGEATAQRVADFLHKFLLRHAVAFYAGTLGLSDDHDRLSAIAGYILTHRLERVTNRDVQRGDRTMRAIREGDIRPLLEQLSALGWLSRIDGPRPSLAPHWIVNPAVHARFADRAQQEAQRRTEAKATIQGVLRPEA